MSITNALIRCRKMIREYLLTATQNHDISQLLLNLSKHRFKYSVVFQALLSEGFDSDEAERQMEASELWKHENLDPNDLFMDLMEMDPSVTVLKSNEDE